MYNKFMFKMKNVFIFVFIVCVAVLAAYRGHGLYSRYVEKINTQKESSPIFAVVDAPSEEDERPQSAIPILSLENNSTQYHSEPAPQPAYTDPLPLISEDEELQKRAETAYAKYAANPIIKQMNEDFKKSGFKDIDFTKIGGPDFGKIIQENPEVQKTLSTYAQNPEFIKLMMEMMQDPEVAALIKDVKQQNKR